MLNSLKTGDFEFWESQDYESISSIIPALSGMKKR